MAISARFLRLVGKASVMRKFSLLAGIGFMVLLAACSKNTSRPSGGSNSPLTGNYTFLYTTGNVNQTEQVTALGSTFNIVTTGSFRSINNAGTIQFTADSAIATGLGYDIDTTFTMVTYQNGSVANTSSQAFTQSFPPATSTSKYQVIGTDSVYFPGGALGTGSLTGGTQVAPPTGGHFTFAGDTLKITSKLNQTYPDNVSGVPTTAMIVADVTIVLLKQN